MNQWNLSRSATLAAIQTAALCLCLAAGAQAQMVYRIVGADGRVTFSDKPPVSTEQGKVAAAVAAPAAAAPSGSMPYDLRQVMSRYPVTLYGAPECAPCASGRAMLTSRGIPFSERSVTTAEDIAALKRLTGETSLPFLNIGSQRIKGYSEAEWTQYLDAAGYPKTSMLPSSYRQTGASPLVAVDKPAAAKAEDTPDQRAEPSPAPSSAPGPSPANPAGIQF